MHRAMHISTAHLVDLQLGSEGRPRLLRMSHARTAESDFGWRVVTAGGNLSCVLARVWATSLPSALVARCQPDRQCLVSEVPAAGAAV